MAQTVHLLDFGLARSLDIETDEASKTGFLIGTLAGMSPEQARGGAIAIDVRVDVYALGLILYRLLSGKMPYRVDGDLVDALKQICETPAPSLSASPAQDANRYPVTPELDAIAHKALAKDLSQRYASIDRLALDLRRYLRGEPIEARTHTTAYLLRKFVYGGIDALSGVVFRVRGAVDRELAHVRPSL